MNIFCAYYNTFYNAKKYYNTAYQEIKQINSTEISSKARQNLEYSIEKSLKLLELYPNSKYTDDARLLLGKSYYYQKKYFSARKFLNQLVQYEPNSNLIPQAKLWLIKIDIADNKFHNAELKIDQLLTEKLKPKEKAELYFIRANLYQKNNNLPKAIDFLEKCVKTHDALQTDALFTIGVIYDSLGNYQKSAEYFKKVFKSNPDEPYDFDSQLMYGIALKKQNKIESALNNFDALLLKELNEQQKAEVHLQIADCLLKQGNIETALLEYQDIINNFSATEQSAAAYYKLGQFFENNMRYKKALQSYLQVKDEYSRSTYVDSSRTRIDALFKLLALQKVISISRKDSSDKVEIDNKIIFSNSDNSYLLDDTSNVSLVKHDNQESEEQPESEVTNEQSRSEIDASEERGLQSRNTDENKRKTSKKLEEVTNPEIKKLEIKELDKNLFLLSELFMLYFNKPDSALYHYTFLIDSLPDTEYTPMAYYNMAYIHENIKNDSSKAADIYQLIVKEFPESESAELAQIKLGRKTPVIKDSEIKSQFKQAERFILEQNNPQEACNIYKSLIRNYPQSELLPKIYFALGWCYENQLDSLDKAFTVYDSLLNKYPQSIFSQKIKPKVQQVKKSKSQQQETVKAVTKTTPDTTKKAAEDSLKILQQAVLEKDTLDQNDRRILNEEKNDLQRPISETKESKKDTSITNEKDKKKKDIPKE